MKMFLIGALIVALAALGFIYYQDNNSISIETGNLSPSTEQKSG
ncbi:MAG: hypothetical protein AAFV69_01905 [Pseudomonadota bacterium]